MKRALDALTRELIISEHEKSLIKQGPGSEGKEAYEIQNRDLDKDIRALKTYIEFLQMANECNS